MTIILALWLLIALAASSFVAIWGLWYRESHGVKPCTCDANADSVDACERHGCAL